MNIDDKVIYSNNMKNIYGLILCLSLFGSGCIGYKQSSVPNIQYGTKIIVFKPYAEDKGYQIDIPADYMKFSYETANRILGYQFYYEPFSYDSMRYKGSKIYIPLAMFIYIQHLGSPNWKNLTKYEKAYNKFFNDDPPVGAYTFEHSGKKYNRYWKDICITTKEFNIRTGRNDYKEIKVGYMNVPLQYKALFDSCLLTLKPLQDTTIEIDDISRQIDSLNQIRNLKNEQNE
jgi:hypothetical protein